MTDTYKRLGANDSSHVRSLVHETVPIDGAIAWSAYGTYPVSNTNINYLAHGMFQSVYDYAYTNASANQIFDLTLGVHEDSLAFAVPPSLLYPVAYDSQYDANAYKRKQIYNALAQRLCGFGTDGSILKFDRDGDFAGGGEKYNEVMAILFTRLLHKDGIKPGSFSFDLALHPDGFATATVPSDNFDWSGAGVSSSSVLAISDAGAETSYRTNSPAGRFAVLYAANPVGSDILDSDCMTDSKAAVGLVFYDAGIVILTPWIFVVYDGSGDKYAYNGFLNDATASEVLMLYNLNGNVGVGDPGDYTTDPPTDPTDALGGTTCYTITELVRGYEDSPAAGTGDVNLTIPDFCNAFRQRIDAIEFQNTTELNSTVYFCKANHNEFNYSSNPTYCEGSRIVNKNTTQDAPSSYITSVGLYSSDGALLAVAKLSEPFKKSSDTDLSLRVRIDY